jgi:hypothetical protein
MARAIFDTLSGEMPTVLRVGPYRFFFFAGDLDEPEHIHIERNDNLAKFWLVPVRLARSRGFAPRELRTIERIIRERQSELQEAWHAYFNG